jgi:hypothetical protein
MECRGNGDNRDMRLAHGASSPLAVGQIRRHELQGTVATYRVLELQGDLVQVEVVEAPGLAAGQRFRFATTALEAMPLAPVAISRPAATRFARPIAA